MAGRKSVIIQVFGNDSMPRRIHDCDLCKIYRREMNKGNRDAYDCYVNHLNYVARKQRGLSVKIDLKD
ncbi:MAG: hypothetical protein M1474_00670 [Candidatus Marsarchaeota archaeon]|jgi:hypothetical protein|nr:hypothetical protein [Candidatus Marsarchaeota archaeon]